MRVAKESIYTRATSVPSLKFEDQEMTSFAGLVVFQSLFERLGLFQSLERCCSHLANKHFYTYGTVLRCLVVHILLGYRQLRDSDHYRDDPLIKRVLRMENLPSVPTISRMLGEFDDASIDGQRRLNRELILDRLEQEKLATITLDFDGSVQSTGRHAEGTAVGFNKQKKGARSYYPLFCTVAQSGQVFDFHHRSGNVHDSNGAIAFALACVAELRRRLPGARIESRLDSAFFSDAMVRALEDIGVEYTISVPFERFAALKEMVGERRWWWATPGSQGRGSYFEKRWKPQSWQRRSRFLFVRNTVAVQNKAPIQLDLFEPREEGYEFKVVVTNKKGSAGKVVRFHEGRGYQEKIYSELKTQAQMGYIPARRLAANKVYLLASILAHNLSRELQMQASAPARPTTEKRTVRWVFEGLATLRSKVIQRAGRLTRPQGRLTLTLGTNHAVENAILHYLKT